MKEDLTGGQLEKDDEIKDKDKSKSKRNRNSPWKIDDTKWFFEALSEYGKDFSSIQTYIAARVDKKVSNPPEQVKNREQVRHYYYRTWHKISSVLTFPEYLDKQTQELYGLINYGEIWKKLGSKFEAKLKLHLNELVNIGQTVVKFKGKNLKIKTPVCKALKKLHKLDDHPSSSSNVNNLPKEIIIELHPATNDAWLRVHSLAQNPRIRIRSPLQKRFSEIIGYLERRWSTSRLRSLMMTTHNRSNSPTMELEPEKLRVFIHSSLLDDLAGIVIKRVPLNFNAQIDLSLSAFLQKFHQNGKEMPEKRKKSVSGLSAGSSSKTKVNETATTSNNEAKESSSFTANQSKNGDSKELNKESSKVLDIDEKSNLPPIAETVRSLSILQDMLASANSEPNNEIESSSTNLKPVACRNDEELNLNERVDATDETSKPESKNSNSILPLPPANATIGEWLGAFIADGHDGDDDNNNNVNNNNEGSKEEGKRDKEKQLSSSLTATNEPEVNPVSSEDKYQTVSHDIDFDTLKNGWTTETTDLLVGELYLILKNPEKLILEYDWIKENNINKRQDDELDYPADKLSTNSESSNNKVNETDPNQTVLDKLVTVASIALLHLKNQQFGGDTNLVLSPVKSKSYSRKNKRLKLGSPPPILQAQASPSHQSTSLLTLSSSPSSASSLITATSVTVSSSHPHHSSLHSSNSTSILAQDRIVSDSLVTSSPNILSSLISDTILNDNIYTEISSSNPNMGATGDKDYSSDPSSPPKIDPSQWFNNLQVSTSPAFKSSTKQPSKVVRCNDPALLQEAIKQLNSTKFNTRKQLRKPMPKPTYIAKPSVVTRCSPNVIGVTFPTGVQSTPTAVATANQLINTPSIINHVVKSGTSVIRSQLTGQQTVQLPMVIPSTEGNIVVSQASVQANFLSHPDTC